MQNQDYDQETSYFQSEYEPESPFLPESNYISEHNNVKEETENLFPQTLDYESIESPFVSEYVLKGHETFSPEATEFNEILNELYESEFDEAVEELVNELAEVYEEKFQGEVSDPTSHSLEAERFLQRYLSPLTEGMEAVFDELESSFENVNAENLTDQEFNAIFDNAFYVPEAALEHKEFFEMFFGKIKKAFKKIKKVASKLNPLNLVIRKLRKIARPLINRVLKVALNKIPPRFRGVARKLAKIFVGGALGKVPGGFETAGGELADYYLIDETSTTAFPDLETIQTELDSLLAGYVIRGMEFDSEFPVVEYFSGPEDSETSSNAILDQARGKFAREIIQVNNEKEAEVVIENFVSAILMAVKLGIRLIGRKRVVNFLAKAVAKLIQKFVGKQAAAPLSRILVDKGMSLLSLEVPDCNEHCVGSSLTAASETIIEYLLANTPTYVIENEALHDSYINEAVDLGIASLVPNYQLRPEIREAEMIRGVWRYMPRGRNNKKRYKKFTTVVDVTITPKIAESIMSFGGVNLKSFLRDVLLLRDDQYPMKGKLHLFEAIRGTTLSYISLLEKNTSGLGSRREKSWGQIHPLTKEAASLLLKEPCMGRDVAPKFLQKRHLIDVGQRFYFIELPGVHQIARAGRGNRTRPGQVNLSINKKLHRLSVYLFFSEVEAQRIKTKINQGAPLHALVVSIQTAMRTGLKGVLSGKMLKNIRREDELVPEEHALPYAALSILGSKLVDILIDLIVKYFVEEKLKIMTDEFVKATENKADGVTIIFHFIAPSLIPILLGTSSIFNPANIFSDLATKKWTRG